MFTLLSWPMSGCNLSAEGGDAGRPHSVSHEATPREGTQLQPVQHQLPERQGELSSEGGPWGGPSAISHNGVGRAPWDKKESVVYDASK